MPTTTGYGIQFDGVPVTGYGKTLADFTTYGNLYQPCAARRTGRDGRGLDLQPDHARQRARRSRGCALHGTGGQGPGERCRHRRAIARRLEQAARVRLDDRHRPDAQRPLGPWQRADPVGDVPEHVRPLLGHRQRLQYQVGRRRRHRCAGGGECDHKGAGLRARQRYRQRCRKWAGGRSGLQRLGRWCAAIGQLATSVSSAAQELSVWTTRCANARW